VAIMRVIQFFFDISGAVVYSAFFVPWGESAGFIEGLAIAIVAFIFSIFGTGLAFLVYTILGALVILGRRVSAVTVFCNIITTISILLSIRAMAIYGSLGQINILLTLFLIIYLLIFSLCLVSYIKIKKKG
jgi:hypothetical protein